MRKRSLLFGIHASPPLWLKGIYVLIPLVIALVMYHHFSSGFLVANPEGKLLPSFIMMAERSWSLASFFDLHVQEWLTYAFEIPWLQWQSPFVITKWIWIDIPLEMHITAWHGNLLWSDTAVSLTRLFYGLSLAVVVGMLFGINIALFPGLQYLALPWIVALSFVPVVAILPILLIALGIGEGAKITLIFLGLVFFIIRDMVSTVREIPGELLVKARTLGASELGLVYRVVLPMSMPNLLESVRMNLGTAWFCLMTGEAIAAQQGLAYRIFLFRRVGPDMAGIIPYVIWITLLAFALYSLLVYAQRWLYPWKE